MTSLARTRPTGAAPSRRLVGVVRAALYGPNVKHGTAARAERASIGTTACVSGFGVASIASSNTSNVGFRRPLLATLYAATQTIGVNRAPSLEMVIGVAAPFNAAFLAEPNPHLRKHANKHGQQTGAANMRASREKFARVAGNAQAIPASNAAPFHSARLTPRAPSPAAAGIFSMLGRVGQPADCNRPISSPAPTMTTDGDGNELR